METHAGAGGAAGGAAAPPEWALTVLQSPDYGVVVYKQHLYPAYMLRLECVVPAAAAGVFPIIVQAELFDDEDKLVPNDVDAKTGIRPLTQNAVRIESLGAETAFVASFEKLRFNVSSRGKCNFIRFLALSNADSPNESRLLAMSVPLSVVISSQSNHQRDVVAKQQWEALGGTVKARAQLDKGVLVAYLQSLFAQKTGRQLSEHDLDHLIHSVAETPVHESTVRFERFKDHIWKILFEVEKILRRHHGIGQMWTTGFVYGFIGRQRAEELLSSIPGVQKGDFLVRFSDRDPGSFGIAFVEGIDPCGILAVSHFKVLRDFLDRRSLAETIQIQTQLERVVRADNTIVPKAALAEFGTASSKPMAPPDPYITLRTA